MLGLIRNIYAKKNYFAKKIFQKLDLSITIVLERFVGAYTIMDKCGWSFFILGSYMKKSHMSPGSGSQRKNEAI